MTIILEASPILQNRLAAAAAAKNMSVEQYALHILDISVSDIDQEMFHEEDAGRPTLADALRGQVGTVHSGGKNHLSQEDTQSFADHLAAKREAGTL